jgi:hypothetical protein
LAHGIGPRGRRSTGALDFLVALVRGSVVAGERGRYLLACELEVRDIFITMFNNPDRHLQVESSGK